ELEILDILGQGGMGIVFKARQPRLDRCVALKILPLHLAAQPGFSERFTREARALARLAHPHIVAIYDFGESAGFFYLIMEFVNGVNLRAAMRAGVKPEQALLLVPRICEALQFAHDHGVLHRDIKPENILLDTTGTPKLADFGIAKLAGEESAKTGLTATGAALGTAAYMAPEQVEKPATVDHRADIYSLGVVLYEMLTGELPLGRFPAPSEKSTVDRSVDEVVMRALEKERERRQQSATEMKTQVEGASHGSAGQVTTAKQKDPLVKRIFLVLCVLSVVGIPVSASFDWHAPTPLHLLLFIIIFGTLSWLSKFFAPPAPAPQSPGPLSDSATNLWPHRLAWMIGSLFVLPSVAISCALLVPELTGKHFGVDNHPSVWMAGFVAMLPFMVGAALYYGYRRTQPGPDRATPRAMWNPWPKRIFLLITALIGVPMTLIGLGIMIPLIVWRSAERPTSPAAASSLQYGAAALDVHYGKADPNAPGVYTLTLNSRTPYGWVTDFSFRIRDEKGEREIPSASYIVAQQQPQTPGKGATWKAEVSWEFSTRDMKDGYFQLFAKMSKGSAGNLSSATSDGTPFRWEPHPGRGEANGFSIADSPLHVAFLRGLPPDAGGPFKAGAEMFILVKSRPMEYDEKAEGFQGFLGKDRFEELIPLSTRQDDAIRRAAQQLDETRERIKARIPTPVPLASAELGLAIAEARGDKSKIAAARLAFEKTRKPNALTPPVPSRSPEIARLQDENIRGAQEALLTTKKRVEVGVASPLDVAAAERNLAVAEARDDELKIATALLAYAETHYKITKAATEQGTASTMEALDAEQELNTARIRVERARDQAGVAKDAAALEKPAKP
ncbi:MAG: protein kinase, partial [Chthoniobacteraceae bacterium]